MHDNKWNQTCGSEQCISQSYRLHNESFSDPSCADENDRFFPGLLFTLMLDDNSEPLVELYQFGCEFDNCNSQSNVENAIEKFHQEYNTSSIVQVFKGIEQEQKETTTMARTTPRTRETVSLGSSTTSQFVASTSTANPIVSSTSTSSLASSSISPMQVNTSNQPKSNHARDHRSCARILGIALIITTTHLLF